MNDDATDTKLDILLGMEILHYLPALSNHRIASVVQQKESSHHGRYYSECRGTTRGKIHRRESAGEATQWTALVHNLTTNGKDDIVHYSANKKR